MTDPALCLRNATIAVAFWNIIYSIIQMAIMGWQCKVVKELQWEFENREIPYYGQGDPFTARFPGLYQLYTETPERRRVNAMYVIVLVNIVLAILHFFFSAALLYGAIKYLKNFIWPWIPSAILIISLSTAYAVLWWSGDIFNEQLTMSVAEFVMSLAINGVCVIIVSFFVFRLNGQLTSNKPSREQPGFRANNCPLSRNKQTEREIPPWRTPWPAVPDPQLQRKLRRQGRRRGEEIDFFAPEPYDQEFPWNMRKITERPPPRPTARETIEKIYYNDNPDELPGLPRGMRESLRKEKRAQRNSVV